MVKRQMRNLHSVFLFFMIFFMASLSVFGMEITLHLDKNELTQEDQLELQVSIEGDEDFNSFPKLRGTEDFEVQSSGSSSQMSIINGVAQSKKIFQFILMPKKAGTFTVGPAEIEVDGKVFHSNEEIVKVSKSQSNKQETNRPVFIETSVSNKEPYVNEQVIFTFKLFSRVQITNASFEKLPEFKGLWKEDLQGEKEYETVINGVPWQVTEIKYAIFPSEEGKMTIEPFQLVASVVTTERRNNPSPFFDSFFNMSRRLQQVRLRSNPVELNVKPLPNEGKPINFSGLVGNFSIRSELSKNSLQVGESATLTLQAEGNGNIRDGKLPDIQWDGFKIYDDRPELNLRKTDKGIMGLKTIKKALVPLRPGSFQIPPIALSYFEPQSHSYKITETQGFSLNVVQAPQDDRESLSLTSPASPSNLKKDIQVVGEDLMPIMRGNGDLTNESMEIREKGILLFLIFLQPVLYLLGIVLRKRREKIFQDKGYWQREKAYKKFKSDFQSLDQEDTLFGNASGLLKVYLGDKLNLDGKALTPMDASRKLIPYKVSSELVKEVEEFLKTCEAGQYGGGPWGPQEKKKIKENLLTIVKKLEKEVRV